MNRRFSKITDVEKAGTQVVTQRLTPEYRMRLATVETETQKTHPTGHGFYDYDFDIVFVQMRLVLRINGFPVRPVWQRDGNPAPLFKKVDGMSQKKRNTGIIRQRKR